jgi:hypothetical protein
MQTPYIYPNVSDRSRVVVLVISAEQGSTVTVYRSYNGTDEIVRGAIDVPVNSDEELVIDYEVPQNVPITYWCVSKKGAEQQQSDKKTISGCNWGRDQILDLGDPKRSMLIWVEEFKQYQYGISRDVQRVWGRRDPVVISGVREMMSGQLRLLTLNLADRANFLEIIKNGSTVAFVPQYPEYGLEGVMYFAVGNVTEERTSTKALEDSRRWLLEVQQVSPPPPYFKSPDYSKTWRVFREETWRQQSEHQWWEAIA